MWDTWIGGMTLLIAGAWMLDHALTWVMDQL